MSAAGPFRIGLIAQGGRAWIGGAELTKNIVAATCRYCERAGQEVSFILIGDAVAKGDFDRLLLNMPRVTWVMREPTKSNWQVLASRVRRGLNLNGSEQPYLRIAREQELDFLYPTAAVGGGSTCRSAAWIYDFQHKELPEFFTADEIASRDAEFQRIAERAQFVVLSSNTAADDFAHYYPNYEDKRRVLRFRVSIPREVLQEDAAGTRAKYNLPERFILVSNNFWQHKNHDALFEAVARLHRRVPDLTVVCTGHLRDYRRESHSDQILARIQQLGIHPSIRILGLIPKHEQLQLMKAAVAVVQPSLFEGWSTVVEEARALGSTIVLSDLKVHREQDVPFATYFEPTSSTQLADLIEHALEPLTIDERRERQEHALSHNEALFEDFGRRFWELASGVSDFTRHDPLQIATK